MKEAQPRAILLKEYSAPAYLVDRVDLHFTLDPVQTRVRSRLSLRRNPLLDRSVPLALDGQDLQLERIALDGRVLATGDYLLDHEGLTIPGVPAQFTLEIETLIHPQDNTALEGLFVSGGTLCTQCEAEGFRRITYFPDRPDVMSVYTVTLEADAARYPVLLSNGNPEAAGELPDGRHFARWHDPYPKPCYLFALVAGDLVCREAPYFTISGREVALRVYTEAHNADKCDHALASLARSMRWDERRFGREYDLDLYMIVAVDDFNMGAMENKGLNLFNSKYVLARADTATDDDYVAVEGVIAHEYFHNWTGNRITCRDWFQLSLKEGLTVFRDQSFTAEETLGAVARIDNVRRLRSLQFPEDAGPMAHPVRPASYIEINNFYTMTVYEKGAEVVRMLETLLGRETFRAGMDLYFERHDGQAVTVEDFLHCMAEASGRDLGPFMRWYDQAGTPRIEVRDAYDAATQIYTLDVTQSCAPTPGQPEKRPLHVPLKLALLDAQGRELPLRLEGEPAAVSGERALELTERAQQFRFVDVPDRPLPSLLRGFSAPVVLDYAYDDATLAFLFAHDTDAFNRWEAGQRLMLRVLLGLIGDVQAGRPLVLPEVLLRAFEGVLDDRAAAPVLVAEALTLPAEDYIAEQLAVIDPQAVYEARSFVRRALGERLSARLHDAYERYRGNGPYAPEPEAMGRRRLRNLCLGYLVAGGDAAACRLALEQFEQADNMTDAMGALHALRDVDCPERERAMAAFEARWRDEPLVLDKWFALQAGSRLPGALDRVRALMAHPGFSIRNPNRVRAVIGAFAHGNPLHFHAADGSGHAFVAEHVMALDALNPQVAARMAKVFTAWRRYDAPRQASMRAQLEHIAARPQLSRDLYEVVSRSLARD
ncbi:MAG: aminopeptidase N [Chromatiales bacterium]|nr:aminopeptidase N [Chromatiales bacterium]